MIEGKNYGITPLCESGKGKSISGAAGFGAAARRVMAFIPDPHLKAKIYKGRVHIRIQLGIVRQGNSLDIIFKKHNRQYHPYTEQLPNWSSLFYSIIQQ